jgi:hypothetical protein
MLSHLAVHTVDKTEGLVVEFRCGLSGDEGQFF